MEKPAFFRYIGIDYSGAQTPSASLSGLRIYSAEGRRSPTEVLPPPSARKYWSRRGIAEWLISQLAEGEPTLVGIDHGFSFPGAYFEAHGLQRDWPAFLDDFQRHWPTDEEIYVDFVREGIAGNGRARGGDTRWRRLTEIRAGAAKSVFHFDVQGSVAKSSHSGIPWLRTIRQRLGSRIHFWPFDGWEIPAGRSAIAEVYPALWSKGFERKDRSSGDQHDAFSVAAWLQQADRDGRLDAALRPDLTPDERELAAFEGWILGVPGQAKTEPIRAPKQARPKTETRSRSPGVRATTQPGYINKNGQVVVRSTGKPGNDHNQVVYVLRCNRCTTEYGANGSDIWQRHCPNCGGGAPGLAVD